MKHVVAARTSTIPRVLLRYWIGIVSLTALSVVYTLAMTRVHHSVHPWGVQLLWGRDAGWDFNVFRDRFALFRTPGFWPLRSYPVTYPAAAGVVLGLLYKLSHPLRDYLLMCSAAVLAWVWWLARKLWIAGIPSGLAILFALTCAATCWPLWLLFDTANIEGVVVVVLALGVLAFVADRCWLAATLIGLAGALKLFPLILLALLLSRRRYREFFCGICVAAAATLASLAILGPSIAEAQRQIDIAFGFLTRINIATPSPQALDADHSLFTLVRSALLLTHSGHLHPMPGAADGDRALLVSALAAYLVIVAVAGLAAYFLHIRRLPMLNQILALSISGVLLPPTSLDYTLLHLLVPFGLLCAWTAQGGKGHRPRPSVAWCFLCFALLFTADTYFTWRFALTSDVRAMVLLLPLVIVLRYPFAWDELDLRTRAANV